MSGATPAAPDFPMLVQRFFLEGLVAQRNVSARTIEAYRDSFRLLLAYLQDRQGLEPGDVTFTALGPEVLSDFLSHLETDRGNSIRTRNARLAAIRSFLRYAATMDPASLGSIQRALAVPQKRFNKPLLGFLTRQEMDAVLEAPDSSSWSGRRDRILFQVMYNTGARVSEAIAVTIKDVDRDRSHCVTLHGKGRKERTVPLWRTTLRSLDTWIKENDFKLDAPLFPSSRGQRMTRSGVEYRLNLAVNTAARNCHSLAARGVSPHTIRHTTAMHLLQSGVDISVIAIWLGHESIVTTHMYLEADLEMKGKALMAIKEPKLKETRFHASVGLIRFLESL
jgi:integrase/recombinase XerD